MRVSCNPSLQSIWETLTAKSIVGILELDDLKLNML